MGSSRVSPSNRDDLRQAVREFENLEGGCTCAISNPPCSYCTHPGNIRDTGSPEELDMEMQEKLENTRFLPGDKVYPRSILRNCLCDTDHLDTALKVIKTVSIDDKGDIWLKVTTGASYHEEDCLAREDAKAEMLSMYTEYMLIVAKRKF